jgi:hypothetical protein
VSLLTSMSERMSLDLNRKADSPMKTPPIVSRPQWEAARQQLLVKEKELTRARDALAADRRRMPWLAVAKEYEFDGPRGQASLPDLFEGRRQLIVYRAFFEPGVFGWPDHACPGCSLVADQVAHVAHLNARDVTLAFVSRAPQPDIERVKARMGWTMPWSRPDRARAAGGVGGLARGLSPDPAVRVVGLARRIRGIRARPHSGAQRPRNRAPMIRRGRPRGHLGWSCPHRERPPHSPRRIRG